MSDFFPDEIVVEILQRLPTKSLIQFRSVSKSWNSLITSPNFINSHLNHSLTSNTYKNSYDNLPLLIVRQCISVPPPRTEHYKLCIDTEESFYEYKQLEFPLKTCRLNFFFAIWSAKGLFCFFEQDRYFLWNPSIRKSMAMPKPTIKTSFHRHGFGFDPRNNDYKVVRIDNFYPTKDEPTTHIEVYSLNAGLWKMSSTAINSYPDGITLGYTERFASYLEGAVHFVANMKKSNDPLILSFDLSDEFTVDLSGGIAQVQFLQERNVNVVIRDKRDLNVIRVREAKEKEIAKALLKKNEKTIVSGKGKENACKGRGKGQGNIKQSRIISTIQWIQSMI
ncbi:hypothetical protein HYC85_030333 [Camellia sinensis]|uniref:F-box domain-containing protein n=1 Tax=Camellia sinensis TaxID=4442 RepID=A0A7J7G0K5_CAMSI|nr:hypothetical protein HYC85_030333 [Camellia sinensis]